MPTFPPATRTIGWDLGGVHVKAALVEGGRVRAAVQAPCPLWEGLPALDTALATLPDWARGEAAHAVTMTGELTDCFADRADGVARLAGWAAARLAGPVRIYAGRAGFVAPDAAGASAADIASANWHATAALVGRHADHALLVDIGSTTADLIPVAGGRPAAAGYSDAERLETGELVYTGVVRSHCLALSDHAFWRGRRVRLMAETFANTADVYRVLGLLPEGTDQQHSADFKGKSLAESEVRLARMVGRDHGEGDTADWTALATHFAEAQLRILHDAAAPLLAGLAADAPLVTCGAGQFLALGLAARLGRQAIPLTDLVAGALAGDAASAPNCASSWASICGPALAVALLAAEPNDREDSGT